MGGGTGLVNDDLVSFIDLAPTILSLAGAPIPDFIQGRDLFAEGGRDYVFAGRDRMDQTVDRVRAVRDERYRLVQNFRVELAYFRPLLFRDMFPIMKALWRGTEAQTLNVAQQQYFMAPRPEYELYDLATDPDEVTNLAGQPELAAVQARLRAALEEWYRRVGDLGDMAEADMVTAMWQGHEQPQTAAPRLTLSSNQRGSVPSEPSAITLTLEPVTKGSSLGYRLDDGEWQLYSRPVEVTEGQILTAKAIRYGYKESSSVTQAVQSIK